MTAKAIMVQGTMSNVGKSLITAGLCRIFKQDGYKVAPFKSQNMALNSFITKEGLEMGRAQVMQAEAAGIEPKVSMNPVLLKPTSDQGSQVIVNGEVWGDMPAREYYRRKRELVPHIMAAYESLARAYDIIVLEGAGSPAEINLRSEDIVNMGMAERADAPVILVGDIDRGGVFASLVGTMMLLEPSERQRVKGTLINKFRGDVQILRPGLTELEKLTGVPVLGVIPYLRLELDDEDSLSERLKQRRAPGLVDIAVISLPHLSNFTDFNVFERIPGVSLRYVRTPGQLGNPDLIILPGSKNTMDDLAWLRQGGLEGEILKAVRRETLIFGVCGGYQMMGTKLSDPYGVEHGGEMAGMGLLNATTVFQRQKVRTQVKGKFGVIPGPLSALSGQAVSGYEIHMGETTDLGGCRPLAEINDVLGTAVRQMDGLMNGQGTVLGSYMHGLFDSEGLAFVLVSALLQKKGLGDAVLENVSEWQGFNATRFKDRQYDILAEAVRGNLDMDRVYAMLGINGKGAK